MFYMNVLRRPGTTWLWDSTLERGGSMQVQGCAAIRQLLVDICVVSGSRLNWQSRPAWLAYAFNGLLGSGLLILGAHHA